MGKHAAMLLLSLEELRDLLGLSTAAALLVALFYLAI
jgi:hypothetical protein